MPGETSYMGWAGRRAGSHYHSTASETTMAGGHHSHICEDMKTVLDGGEHGHDVKDRVVTSKGEHAHAYLVPEGKWIFTEPNSGAHEHEVEPDNDAQGGQHEHVLTLPDGKKLKTLSHEDIRSKLVEKSLPPNFWGDVV